MMALSSSNTRAEPTDGTTDERTEYALEPDTFDERQTTRWYGVTVFALLALGLGVLTSQPGLLLASAFGVAFAGYGKLTTLPALDLALERTLSDPDPADGDEVTVTVTVRNEADHAVLDLRLVDGVPPQLAVVDGTPRHATALRAGGETTYSYTVRARRGDHVFQPMTTIARDASGATERVSSVQTDTNLACKPPLPTATVEFPLRPQTSRYTGRFPADEGGPGVEFYSTREYQPGDPLSRIDWNRTARTGEFTTVDYRVERTATIVLLIDAREAAYRASEQYGRSAVERSVDAARRAYVSLTGEGHTVGISALSPVDCWLDPGRGSNHRVRARRLFGTHRALSPVPESDDTNLYVALQTLQSRLPADAQVVLFSPLCDDHVTHSAIRLDAHGYKTTVVSPDPTSTDTTGHRMARARRTLRLANLRRRAIPVIDWDGDDSLEQAIARSQRRWSK